MLFFKALHLQKMEEAAGVVVSPAAQAAYPPSPATPLRLQGSVSSPPPQGIPGLDTQMLGNDRPESPAASALGVVGPAYQLPLALRQPSGAVGTTVTQPTMFQALHRELSCLILIEAPFV